MSQLGLPRAAVAYLAVVVTAGAALLLAAGARAEVPASPAALLVALVLVGGCYALQVRSPVIVWRGSRISIHADEGLLMLGFFALPAATVVLAAAAASVLGQWKLRKPLVKGTFNISAQTVATGAGAAVFSFGLDAGLAPLDAALLVPMSVAAVNQAAVAALLSRISGEAWWRSLKPSLLFSVCLAGVAGLGLGVATIHLYLLHPLALLALLPMAPLLHRALTWGYHQDNELTTRRALSDIGPRLLGTVDDDEVARVGLQASRDAFAPLAAGIELRTDGGDVRTWQMDEDAARQPKGKRVVEALLDEKGRAIGELWIVLSTKDASHAASVQALLKIMATQLSLSFVNARLVASLERSERRLRHVLDSARDAVIVVDHKGAPVYANPPAACLGGGRDPWARLSPSSRLLVQERLEGRCYDELLQVGTGDGEAASCFEMSMTRIPLGAEGNGVLFVARDTTERARMEREAGRQREALAHAERLASLGTLVAGVAHEVNNPLMYIGGSLDLMELDVDDLQAALPDGSTDAIESICSLRKQLGTARAGVDRIGLITRGLKWVARESGPATLRPVRLDLVLEEVMATLRPSLGCDARLEAEGLDQEVVVLGDAQELHQVFLDLLKNGVEALGGGAGCVRAFVRAGPRDVEVRITDTGPGVPPELRGQLFTPFFTTKPDGTGLGLATAFSLVKKHGGELDEIQGRGAGATFRVVLPRSPPEPAPAAAQSGDQAGVRSEARPRHGPRPALALTRRSAGPERVK